MMSTIQNIASHISQRPVGSLPVQEIHSEEEVYDTYASRMYRDGLILFLSGPRTQKGKHVWLEFKFDPTDEAIRVLAEICEIKGNQVKARFEHMWPKDEKRYFDFLARACAA